MSFKLDFNWVREVIVVVLMLLFIYITNSNIEIIYKIGIAVMVFTLTILMSLKTGKKFQSETTPSSKISQQLNAEERILWYARPLKTPFLMGVLESLLIGIGSIAIIAYLAWNYVPSDGDFPPFTLFGSIFAGLFLLYAPYRIYKGTDSEYMVTDQRVFFETLTEYAFEEVTLILGGPRTVKVLNLEDVQDTYVKRGLHDRIFGTSTLYVRYLGFQRTTAHGREVLYHNPPSFPFIKEASEVQKIIREAAERAQRNK